MALFDWEDEPESDLTHCPCHCHGQVTFSDQGVLVAYMKVPPRLDNDQGWAEACGKCELKHWIAASVHNQVVSMEADTIDDANCYVLKIKREK